MTTTTTDEQIVTIPWSQLHDSPLQYRQTYSDATIAEIAASIIATGRIQQPLVVRLAYPNPLFRDQYDAQDGFEIVFGHTRKRAGIAAGLSGAPCVVRNMTDAQVRAAQAAENIARSDVHPIEEAEGFRAMIDAGDATADELAVQLGKSRSHVYGRLKLLALCPEVRRAVLAGEVGTEVGLLIARVGSAKLQTKALGYIKSKYYSLEDGGKKSFRQIRDLLNERFTLELKSAIFDIDDEMLLPSAGYCGRCPKRSGNAPEFDDLLAEPGKPGDHYSRSAMRHSGADICTDPDCFDAKKRAHLAREVDKLQQQGKTVITGNKARAAVTATGDLKGDYIDASKVRDALKKAVKAAKDGGKSAPQVLTVQDQRTGKTIEAVRRSDLAPSGAKLPPPPPTRGPVDSAAARATREAERQEREARLADENTRRRALLDRVRAKMRTTERSTFDLQLLAQVAYAGVNWSDRELLAALWDFPDDECEDLEPRIATLTLGDLTQFAMDCALIRDVKLRDVYFADKDAPDALLSAAAHYGIDAADIGSTPPTAARAQIEPRAGANGDDGQPGIDGEDQEDEQMDDAGCAGGRTANAEALDEVQA